MINYAVCEIAGKQYKVTPNQPLEVDFQGGLKEVIVKALLVAEDGKLRVGDPYLKETLTLKVVEDLKGDKIRVAKFHAKANYRRVRGHRSKLSKVVLIK